MFPIADIGRTTRRIVKCNKDTLNTPYKAGLTSGIDTGTAIISMGSVNYGVIFYLPDGGAATAPYICKKTNGVWGGWVRLTTNADILTKTVNLTQVTVPANSGTAGSTINISAQIPAGYKLLDAREVGSGNNGCYVYFFNFDGVNITLQIRNITNAAITTTPVARLLLISK